MAAVGTRRGLRVGWPDGERPGQRADQQRRGDDDGVRGPNAETQDARAAAMRQEKEYEAAADDHRATDAERGGVVEPHDHDRPPGAALHHLDGALAARDDEARGCRTIA
ncbi:MAG: hypothetical protein AB7P78_08850 [Candidatus Binatia bacterium]